MILRKTKGDGNVSEEQMPIEEAVKEERREEKTEKKKINFMEISVKQVTMLSVAFFLTFCCCILFFFLIYRYNGLADYWAKIAFILQPVTIGIVLAYLLNPIVNAIESRVKKPIKKLPGPDM